MISYFKFFAYTLIPYFLIFWIEHFIFLFIKDDSAHINRIIDSPFIFFCLFMLVTLLSSTILAFGFRTIVKKYDFSKKGIVLLLLWGTYWYNFYLIPVSIMLTIHDGVITNFLGIVLLGPMVFFLPTICFIWICKRKYTQLGLKLNQ